MVRMMHIRSIVFTGALVAWAAAVAQGVGPQAGQGQRQGQGAGQAAPQPIQAPPPRVRPEAYPQHEPGDPDQIARGKTLYSVTCSFCHGSDGRGGENNGPNLLRSELVMKDQKGELMTPVVQNGRVDRGMPKFDLTAAQVADIAAFVHSFRVAGYDESRMKPPSILVGDARAGQAYFASTCGSCHSVTGDLAGVGGKFADAKTLQQAWLLPRTTPMFPGMPGSGGSATLKVPPTTVTVTLTNGEKVEGRLRRIDDFTVSLVQEDGTPRSFRREGDTPKVEVHDPLKPHKDLLRTYTDKNIHDVTAYLVTVK
jgi:cytochrome c oxidase cbb3-type subunit 3